MSVYVGLAEVGSIRKNANLERWKPLGVKTAHIACCHSGSCEACESLDGRTYTLAKMPELPYEHCTCALGCRCLYFPDLGF